MPTKRDWTTIIDEFKKSGLTQGEFARQHNLAANTLSYNLKRLSSPKPNGKEKPSENDFIQLNGIKPTIEILAGNLVVRIPATIEESSFKRILGVLDERTR